MLIDPAYHDHEHVWQLRHDKALALAMLLRAHNIKAIDIPLMTREQWTKTSEIAEVTTPSEITVNLVRAYLAGMEVQKKLSI